MIKAIVDVQIILKMKQLREEEERKLLEERLRNQDQLLKIACWKKPGMIPLMPIFFKKHWITCLSKILPYDNQIVRIVQPGEELEAIFGQICQLSHLPDYHQVQWVMGEGKEFKRRNVPI